MRANDDFTHCPSVCYAEGEHYCTPAAIAAVKARDLAAWQNRYFDGCSGAQV